MLKVMFVRLTLRDMTWAFVRRDTQPGSSKVNFKEENENPGIEYERLEILKKKGSEAKRKRTGLMWSKQIVSWARASLRVTSSGAPDQLTLVKPCLAQNYTL